MHNEDAGHISLGDGGGGSGGRVFVFSVITIPDHGRRRNAQFSPQFHSESTKFPKLFFFFPFFFCSLMSDRQLCSFKWEGDREREREFLPLIVFWRGCLESVSWCVFEKIGYAIKLNIVMLEWSSTQLWSPDAIWKKQTFYRYYSAKLLTVHKTKII